MVLGTHLGEAKVWVSSYILYGFWRWRVSRIWWWTGHREWGRERNQGWFRCLGSKQLEGWNYHWLGWEWVQKEVSGRKLGVRLAEILEIDSKGLEDSWKWRVEKNEQRRITPGMWPGQLVGKWSHTPRQGEGPVCNWQMAGLALDMLSWGTSKGNDNTILSPSPVSLSTKQNPGGKLHCKVKVSCIQKLFSKSYHFSRSSGSST